MQERPHLRELFPAGQRAFHALPNASRRVPTSDTRREKLPSCGRGSWQDVGWSPKQVSDGWDPVAAGNRAGYGIPVSLAGRLPDVLLCPKNFLFTL